jgi:hypothetical protein
LNISSTYYLRAQVGTNGALWLYTQKGTDADAIPATQIGTPNGASGGGFDSTVVDMLIAKIVTGSAGTLPTVTPLANAASFRLDVFDSTMADAANAVVYNAIPINLARRVEPIVSLQAWSIGYEGTALIAYRDGAGIHSAHVQGVGNIPQSVICFCSTCTRYSITVAIEMSESDITQEYNNPVYYQVSIRG